MRHVLKPFVLSLGVTEVVVYLVLNGPPRSGKTTIARELTRLFGNKLGGPVYTDEFIAPMKHFIAVALGGKYQEMPRDVSVDVLGGKTIRQFLINMSDDYIRATYGEDIFGRWLVNRSLRYPALPAMVIVDDGGRVGEIEALSNRILVHVIKVGTAFTDNREYLVDPNFIIHNNTNLDELWITCGKLVNDVMTHLRGPQV